MSNSKDKDAPLATHIFQVNPALNGGQSIIIRSKYTADGDPITDEKGVLLTQDIILYSYGNYCTLSLENSPLTPVALRKLANQLEQVRNKIPQTKEKE